MGQRRGKGELEASSANSKVHLVHFCEVAWARVSGRCTESVTIKESSCPSNPSVRHRGVAGATRPLITYTARPFQETLQ